MTFINIAIPSGCWKGNFDVMINDDDRVKLIELRKKYKNILRDIWNPFDRKYEKSLGCQTMSKLYITPNGDVLPCSFIHIKLGNLYEQNLKEIIDYGYTIKYFHDYCETCLAGENRWFVETFMMGEMSMQYPLDAKELFQPEDYVNASGG
jgi:MoaA/NifB/PqqE/SkfB family radical SAM enzyme